MKIKTRFREGVVILDISGEVTGQASYDLQKSVRKQIDDGNIKIVLNLDEVSLMDSVALGILVACLTQLKRKGGKIVFLAPPPYVRALTGFSFSKRRIFEEYNDEGLAVASFAS